MENYFFLVFIQVIEHGANIVDIKFITFKLPLKGHFSTESFHALEFKLFFVNLSS